VLDEEGEASLGDRCISVGGLVVIAEEGAATVPYYYWLDDESHPTSRANGATYPAKPGLRTRFEPRIEPGDRVAGTLRVAFFRLAQKIARLRYLMR